jgi:hypothetical protein
MNVILDVFSKVAEDNDPSVRQAVCQFIIGVCNDCDSAYHEELLQILEKVCILV